MTLLPEPPIYLPAGVHKELTVISCNRTKKGIYVAKLEAPDGTIFTWISRISMFIRAFVEASLGVAECTDLECLMVFEGDISIIGTKLGCTVTKIPTRSNIFTQYVWKKISHNVITVPELS